MSLTKVENIVSSNTINKIRKVSIHISKRGIYTFYSHSAPKPSRDTAASRLRRAKATVDDKNFTQPPLDFSFREIQVHRKTNTRQHGRTGHIFIGVAAGFPSRSTPSGDHPQAGLSAALGVAALWSATDSKFTINSYF